jgi:glycine oxidase
VSGEHPVDVIVVGSGVVGLSIARELGRAGITTSCIGPGHDGDGAASAAAGAMLGALGEVTAGAAGEPERDELLLRLAAAAAYPGFVDELEDETGRTVARGSGTVVVANLVNEQDRANLRAISATAHEHGVRVEDVDPDEVAGLNPARGYEAVGACHLPDEGWVDTSELLVALAYAVRTGERTDLERATVSGIRTDGGRVVGVELADGTVRGASTVVLAAGVAVQELLDGIGEPVGPLPGLLPGKGVSIRVRAPELAVPHVIRTPNRDFACGTHVVPRGDGSTYIGATNRVSATPGAGPGITPGELHSLLNSAIHEINTGFRTAEYLTSCFGLRPLTTDHHPLVGATAVPGLFVATGTYRNGVLLAPELARVVTEELTGRAPHNPFRPDAPFRRGRVRREEMLDAVDAGMRDLVSFLVEPGGHLPYNRHRELRTFLQALGRGAACGGDTAEFRRMRELLERYPIAEMVPQVFYEITTDRRPA